MDLFDFTNTNYLADLDAALVADPQLDLNTINYRTGWTLLFSARFAEATHMSGLWGSLISDKIMALGGTQLGRGINNLTTCEYNTNHKYKPTDEFVNLVINDALIKKDIEGLVGLVINQGQFNNLYELKDYQLTKIIDGIINQKEVKIEPQFFIDSLKSVNNNKKPEIKILFNELIKKIDLNKKYSADEYFMNNSCFFHHLILVSFFNKEVKISNEMISYLIKNTNDDNLKSTKWGLRLLIWDGFLRPSQQYMDRENKILGLIKEELKERGSIHPVIYFLNMINFFKKECKGAGGLSVAIAKNNPSSLEYLHFNFDQELNSRLENLNNKFKEIVDYLSENDKLAKLKYYGFMLKIKTDYFKELRSSLFNYSKLQNSDSTLKKEARNLLIEQIDNLYDYLNNIINQKEDLNDHLTQIKVNNRITEAKLK